MTRKENGNETEASATTPITGLALESPYDIADLKPDVSYVPDFLQAKADELLTRIRTGADFRQNYIQLYGRKAVPRLEAWYGPWDYPYSKGVTL